MCEFGAPSIWGASPEARSNQSALQSFLDSYPGSNLVDSQAEKLWKVKIMRPLAFPNCIRNHACPCTQTWLSFDWALRASLVVKVEQPVRFMLCRVPKSYTLRAARHGICCDLF